MANPLSIYSGPGQIALYDATNDVYHLGYSKEISVSGEPQQHELMDGNLHQYATLFKLNAQLLQSNQSVINEIKTRRSVKQEIIIVGLESLLRIKNVFPALKVLRPFKTGSDAHIAELMAQTNIEDDVIHYENILAADGKFEVDSNSDGFADGWTALGGSQGSLVTSFLSGEGKAQSVQSNAANDGMYYDVLMPFENEITATWSIYAKNTDTATQNITLFIELLDVNGTSIATYTQNESFAAGENRRVNMSKTIIPGTAVKTVRVGIKIQTALKTFEFDNAQLELGSLTNFKAY